MLRYTTDRARSGLVALYTTSGQETEWVNSYNTGARTGQFCLQHATRKSTGGRLRIRATRHHHHHNQHHLHRRRRRRQSP